SPVPTQHPSTSGPLPHRRRGSSPRTRCTPSKRRVLRSPASTSAVQSTGSATTPPNSTSRSSTNSPPCWSRAAPYSRTDTPVTPVRLCILSPSITATLMSVDNVIKVGQQCC
uniref:Hydrophobin n=1 Tax=Mesocestoides corti TaxID=53468 RepID=A0A5K3G2H1_MESCO